MSIAGKPRKNAKSAAGPEAQRERLVEEFAQLDREIDNYLPRIRRHEKLRQLILDWHKDMAPDQERIVTGITCDILISARDKMRSVTVEGKNRLFRLWGPKSFIAKATVLLKVLPDPEDKEGLYTEHALSGPRHLHVVKRAAAAHPAA